MDIFDGIGDLGSVVVENGVVGLRTDDPAADCQHQEETSETVFLGLHGQVKGEEKPRVVP